ncbi:MAG TPA: hypothetical protein VFS26_05670 [Solirubrobacterales bacterium]|nr:hypothetical protein [Solirubrobacterales bacterium]
MNDDWRLQIDFVDEGLKDHLLDRLDAEHLEHDLSEDFGDSVIVSRNGTTVFLYAGDRDQAEKARDLVARLMREDSEEVSIDFRRWHPLAEEWRPADEPLPDEPAEESAERRASIERETAETEARGYPEFEVRVDLSSRAEAIRFAEKLRAEGLPAVHRWRYLLVGAVDEEQAEELAERIKAEAPAGSAVKAEGTWQAAYAERPRSPFSFLGGLAE